MYFHQAVIYSGIINYISNCMPLTIAVAHATQCPRVIWQRWQKEEGTLGKSVATSLIANLTGAKQWHQGMHATLVAQFPSVHTKWKKHNQACQERGGSAGKKPGIGEAPSREIL